MLRRPPRTPLETGLEAISLFGLFGGALLLTVLWPRLPTQVPGHFDAAGNVTRHDPKGSLWGLVAVNTGLYVLLSIINFFPQAWNLPGTPEDRTRQFLLARTVVRALKAFVMWLDVRVAQGAITGLPWWFLPLGLSGPLVIMVVWLLRANRDPA